MEISSRHCCSQFTDVNNSRIKCHRLIVFTFITKPQAQCCPDERRRQQFPSFASREKAKSSVNKSPVLNFPSWVYSTRFPQVFILLCQMNRKQKRFLLLLITGKVFPFQFENNKNIFIYLV